MNRKPASAPAPGKSAPSLTTQHAPLASSPSLADQLIDSHWNKSWKTTFGELPAAPQRNGTSLDAADKLPELSLFAPLHYERRYAYPLLVWLHSDGGNQRELRQIMPHVSLRNHVAVAVQGPSTLGDASSGFCWRQTPADVAEAADRVRQAIDLAQQRYHVHPERVFLVGYESGGTMALRLGLRHPDWFAGAVSLEGPMPQGHQPLAGINRARRLPLLIAACQDSRCYPADRVSNDLRLLHAAGFSLALRQYPGEHDLTTEMLADVDRWMLERFCGASATV